MNRDEIKKIVNKYIKYEESKRDEWKEEGLESEFYDYINELRCQQYDFIEFLGWYEDEYKR